MAGPRARSMRARCEHAAAAAAERRQGTPVTDEERRPHRRQTGQAPSPSRSRGSTPVLFGRRAGQEHDDDDGVRAAIVQVYASFAPERVESVDRLLAQHAGGEAELLAKIVAKYGGDACAGGGGGQAPTAPRRRTPLVGQQGRSRGGGPAALTAARDGCRPDWDTGAARRPAAQASAVPLPPVAALPLELLRCCMRWLDRGTDLGRCACVCRVWRTAAQDDTLWRPMYFSTWPDAAADAEGGGAVTPRRAPGPWRHSFRVRWVKQCEGRLRSYLDRMARVSVLQPRRGAPNCYDLAPTFGSLRKLVEGLGLTFQVRVNGSLSWYSAKQLTNAGGRRGETRGEVRGLSCSLRCPTAALKGVTTVGDVLSVEILAHSELLGRRFAVCTAHCRREPTPLEARRGNLPAPSELWRLVVDDAVKLYELPMGGSTRANCRNLRPGGVSSSGGATSAITLVAFEEAVDEPTHGHAPLGGAPSGPTSALEPADGLGAIYCQVSHADVVEQLLTLTGRPLDPGVPLSPKARGNHGSSSRTLGGAVSVSHRLGGRRGEASNSLGEAEVGGSGTIWGHSPRVDDLDSRFGLHDYAVGVTLRSFGKMLWEEFFQAVDANDDGPAAQRRGGANGRADPRRQQADAMAAREGDVSLVLVSRNQAMGSRWDTLGGGGRSMDAPCLLWRSEGGLSGAAAGCLLAEIAIWDDAGELICARTQAVHLAPVAESSADTRKADALTASYTELTSFQLKKMCREKNLNPAGGAPTLVERLVLHECPPKSRASDSLDGSGGQSNRRNGGGGSSGKGTLDFDTACAEGRLLRGASADKDGDVSLCLELLLEEPGGVIGGKGGGGGSEVVDLRVTMAGRLMRDWWGHGWSASGRAPLLPQAVFDGRWPEDEPEPDYDDIGPGWSSNLAPEPEQEPPDYDDVGPGWAS